MIVKVQWMEQLEAEVEIPVDTLNPMWWLDRALSDAVLDAIAADSSKGVLLDRSLVEVEEA